MAAKKPSGIEIIPGFVSGNSAFPTRMVILSGAQTFVLMNTRMSELTSSTSFLSSSRRVKTFPKDCEQNNG